MDGAERFAALVETYAATPGVTPPDGKGGRRFGATALRVDGSIFAMLLGGQLVVKLPAERVSSLIAEGAGEPFGMGTKRPMKEWLCVVGDDAWESLAEEARLFVGPGQT